MSIVLIVLAVLVLWPFVLGPVLIGAIQTIPIRPNFIPLGHDRVPPEVAAFLGPSEYMLGHDGFEFVGRYTLDASNGTVKTTTFFTLFVQRHTGDIGLAVTLHSHGVGVSERQSFIQFFTQLPNGKIVVTNNLRTVGFWFEPIAEVDGLSLPMVHNTHDLYRLHCGRVSKVNPQNLKGVSPAPGAEMEFWLKYEEFSGAARERQGYYRRVKQTVKTPFEHVEEVYKLTWKGALWGTWGLAQPVLEIRKTAAENKAKRYLESINRPVWR